VAKLKLNSQRAVSGNWRLFATSSFKFSFSTSDDSNSSSKGCQEEQKKVEFHINLFYKFFFVEKFSNCVELRAYLFQCRGLMLKQILLIYPLTTFYTIIATKPVISKFY